MPLRLSLSLVFSTDDDEHRGTMGTRSSKKGRQQQQQEAARTRTLLRRESAAVKEDNMYDGIPTGVADVLMAFDTLSQFQVARHTRRQTLRTY